MSAFTTTNDDAYDVAIVGASIAGCSAAILYGRAGLRVALVERNRNLDSYKAMCGHFIQGGTKATLERMDLWHPMLAAGATISRPSMWVGSGWVERDPDDDVPPAISLRRSKLDPLLRRIAASTPGVDLIMGHAVTGLVREEDRITGVQARSDNGALRSICARLVVGADGHRSAVARLAGVPEETAPNGRFWWWAYYRGVRSGSPGGAQVWLGDPDAAVVVPAGDDLTLLGAFPSKDRIKEFAGDRIAALERFISERPDAPDLAGAERVSNAIGTTDYPLVKRHPTPCPGLALIGDAAMASDPTPAVGCGSAFVTAECLADATAPALRGEADLATALAAYRRARSYIDDYDALARQDASSLEINPVQRAIREAALGDRDIAHRLALFGMRAAPPSVLINRETAARAIAISRSHGLVSAKPADSRSADDARVGQ